MTTRERANVVPNAQAAGPTKERLDREAGAIQATREAGGFKSLIFGALSKKTLAPSSVFVRKQGRRAVDASAVEPIVSERDQQSGTGATAPWWTGTKTGRRVLSKGVVGRAPTKTGVGSFQRYRRAITPQRCEAVLSRQPRPGDHKLMDEIAKQARRCSRQAPIGWTKCTQHGLGRRSRGTLVELLPEEVPVLVCDR